MSHTFVPEEDSGVRIIVDTLASVDFYTKELPEQTFCAGKVCGCCGEPSIVTASMGMPAVGPAVKVTSTFKLSDAEAYANHILAEVKRLREEGHVETVKQEQPNAVSN